MNHQINYYFNLKNKQILIKNEEIMEQSIYIKQQKELQKDK
jgi:hypothetical protein